MSKILVAMSGGVDSSVASALLKTQGHEVIGVHMKLHDEVKEVIPKSCCGQQDAIDAAQVCNELNIPYFVTDYRAHFQKFVISNFIEEYQNGRTPIPCTHCNGILKFDLLIQLAQTLGCDKIATGHYAQLENSKLFRAYDTTKDQSYFLFPINPLFRNSILFPLANHTKDAVRLIAKELDLPTMDKPESQNLCFAPGGTHRKFIERHGSPVLGHIKHEDGTVLTSHNGIHNFTVGQRKGLNITYKNLPLFVTRIEKETGTVFVSHIREANAVDRFIVKGWCSWDEPTATSGLAVVTRYRRHPVPVIGFSLTEDYGARIIYTAEPVVPTPGQAAVIYRDNQVIGGGWIE